MLQVGYPNLTLSHGGSASDTLRCMAILGSFHRRITQTAGDACWAASLRWHNGGMVLHLPKRAIKPISYSDLRDVSRIAKLNGIESLTVDIRLECIIGFSGIGQPWNSILALRPATGIEKRQVSIA